MQNQSLRRRTQFIDPFDLFFGTAANTTPGRRARSPYFTAREEEARYVIEAELPGLAEEDISIQVKADEVRIASADATEENPKITRLGTFQKVYQFESQLNVDDASASLERGILSISLPKAASAVPRTLSLSPSP